MIAPQRNSPKRWIFIPTTRLRTNISATFAQREECCTRRSRNGCAALNLDGRSEDARVLEQTFATSGFDAAVRTLGARVNWKQLTQRRARGEYVRSRHYVLAHIRRGNTGRGILAVLAKTAEERDWFALQLRVNPLLDPLRNDPRFREDCGSLVLK